MEHHSRGLRVQVYFGEADLIGRRPAYEVLLEHLRQEGAVGATVTRGIAGFGAASRIKTAAVLRLWVDLPLVLTWIDAPARVERLLPGLLALLPSGISTVDEVEVAAYGLRQLQQLRFDLDLRDAMTRPAATIVADRPVSAAARALLGRPYRALPVVDAAGRLIGVLSNSDLVERAGLGARIELLEAMSPEARERILAQLAPGLTVGEVMTPDPIAIAEGRSLGDAARLMSQRSLKRLMVVDAAGRLAGVISRADILRAVAESFPRAAGGPAGRRGARTVTELMRTDVPVVPSDADLATVVAEVVSSRLNRAIVVDAERRVLGVVSDADVLRAVDPAAGGRVLGALMRGVGRAAGIAGTAAELIGSPPVVVGPDTPLADAARAMTVHRRKVLPVVDADGRLLGALDRADLLHAARAVLDELRTAPEVDREP